MLFLDEFNDAGDDLQADLIVSSEVENHNLSVYIYIKEDHGREGSWTSCFSLRKCNRSIEWHPTGDIIYPDIDYMRSIILDNRRYYLKNQAGQFSFFTSSSVDFSAADTQSLAFPPPACGRRDNKPHFYMCNHKNLIYACSKYCSNNLFSYNSELDKWFPISFVTNKEFGQC